MGIKEKLPISNRHLDYTTLDAASVRLFNKINEFMSGSNINTIEEFLGEENIDVIHASKSNTKQVSNQEESDLGKCPLLIF